jgi:hypothetical protein
MAPLTPLDASEMLEDMKGRVLLRGYRGAPPADECAFRTVLLRISRLLDICPEIQELDINPIIVHEHGAVAADVRVRVATPPARAAVGGR